MKLGHFQVQMIENIIPVATHALAALAPLLWWSASRGEFSIILILGAAIMGNIADVDTAYSRIGRLTRPLSKRIEAKWSHRTITHSLIAVAVIAVVSFVVCIPLPIVGPWWWWPVFYSTHLILDMVIGGKTGVPLLWPSKTKFNLAAIEGGSTGERVICLILLVGTLLPLAINPTLLDPNRLIRQATGSVEMALYDYRQWEAEYEVELEIEGTWQTDRSPITGTYPIQKVVGNTFHLIGQNNTPFTASQSGTPDVYITSAVAHQGPPRQSTAAISTPTPTSVPTITVVIRIPHVYDLSAEILVQVNDELTPGQLLADLSTYRAIIATPLPPTPAPTVEEATPLPAGISLVDVNQAEADLALARARYWAAISTPTPNAIAVATIAPQATAWAQFVQDREDTLYREQNNPGGELAWRARTELEQYSPRATSVAYQIDRAMHPPGPDPLNVQIAWSALQVAQARHESAMSTPTPRSSATPTPTPPPDQASAIVDNTRIRSLVSGRITEIRIASISGNEATVEIVVVQVVAENVAQPGRIATTSATVSRVVDGDTAILILEDGREEDVRFIGVDTPETKHPTKDVECYGPEASSYTTSLLPVGAIVHLEMDVEERDRYERLLAYVWLGDGRMLNEILVIEGYAQMMSIPPNVRYADRFQAAERGAREGEVGLWGACP